MQEHRMAQSYVEKFDTCLVVRAGEVWRKNQDAYVPGAYEPGRFVPENGARVKDDKGTEGVFGWGITGCPEIRTEPREAHVCGPVSVIRLA